MERSRNGTWLQPPKESAEDANLDIIGNINLYQTGRNKTGIGSNYRFKGSMRLWNQMERCENGSGLQPPKESAADAKPASENLKVIRFRNAVVYRRGKKYGLSYGRNLTSCC